MKVHVVRGHDGSIIAVCSSKKNALARIRQHEYGTYGTAVVDEGVKFRTKTVACVSRTCPCQGGHYIRVKEPA